MSISVLIITRNEAKNISSCIESLSPLDDVVVLDSFSSDATVELARSLGATVYQRHFDSFAEQRNYALDHLSFKHDWVLHLDADEILVPDLVAELKEAVTDDRYDAYRIPSKLMMSGRWLRFSGQYPVYQVRLGRRSALRFQMTGHGQREILDPTRIGTLATPYLHYAFSRGLTNWVQKHIRYAETEASRGRLRLKDASDWSGFFALREPTRRRRALKDLSTRLPFRPLLRFVYMYILRRGFLDGRQGLTYCTLMSIFEYLIVLRVRELHDGCSMTAPSESTTPRTLERSQLAGNRDSAPLEAS